MALHELIYLSSATREMSTKDLSALLDQSQEKNARLNITGLLIYHQREFMQLLEGDKSEIFSLYETICKDNRNKQNILLWDSPVEQRSFADWSMAFLTPDNLPLQGKPAYSSFLQTGLSHEDPDSPPTVGKTFLLSLRDDFLKKQ
ncbi:MAG: BLUF domain-containing protein [Gammaproteobacteria bacterium]|nr:BLUF domain-containing protein [Gammaproteobacteria bacterium]